MKTKLEDMNIEVKNNNIIKAYRLLMKKLDKDGLFKELKDKRYYKSKSLRRREKHEYAIKRIKKEDKKREEQKDKDESRILIESKKRAREYKQKQKTYTKKP